MTLEERMDFDETMIRGKLFSDLVSAYDNLIPLIPDGLGYNKQPARVVIKVHQGLLNDLLLMENCVWKVPDQPDIHYVFIYGYQTPIIVVDDLPEDIPFVMQLKEDYEFYERAKLEKKLSDMFGGEYEHI